MLEKLTVNTLTQHTNHSPSIPNPTALQLPERNHSLPSYLPSLPFFSSFISHHKKFVVGTMGGRMGLMFLVVLGVAWACDAREMANRDRWSINAANTGYSELSRKPDVCALCEEYTAKAIEYLNEKKTQSEIIDILHNSCHQLRSFEQQCISLVDYYASLFFSEIGSIQPGDFCNKVNLCQNIANISLQVQEDSCGFCKYTVSALLAKLKDPNTELEIIETLLKVCSSVEKYVSKCKRMVFEYGPLVFHNAEKFLETTDICTVLHACKASTVVGQKSFLSDS